MPNLLTETDRERLFLIAVVYSPYDAKRLPRFEFEPGLPTGKPIAVTPASFWSKLSITGMPRIEDNQSRALPVLASRPCDRFRAAGSQTLLGLPIENLVGEIPQAQCLLRCQLLRAVAQHHHERSHIRPLLQHLILYPRVKRINTYKLRRHRIGWMHHPIVYFTADIKLYILRLLLLSGLPLEQL